MMIVDLSAILYIENTMLLVSFDFIVSGETRNSVGMAGHFLRQFAF